MLRLPRSPSLGSPPLRPVRLLAACAVAVTLLAAPAAASAAPPTGLGPVGDASVRSDHPKTNYASVKTMRVASRSRAVSYVQFLVPRMGSWMVQRAVLRLYVASGRTAGMEVREAASHWSEKRLTWSRRPAVGRVLGVTTAPRGGGRWVSVDVTPAVRDGGYVAFAIDAPRGGVRSLAARGSKQPPLLALRSFVDRQPKVPLLTGLYLPWLADTSTHYHPLNAAWKAQTPASATAQLASLRWAGFKVGVAWWDTFGSAADTRFASMLAATRSTRSPLRWALWEQGELLGDPTPAELTIHLDAVERRYGRDPAYLRVRRRPVVFLALSPSDGCPAVQRWVSATGGRFYLVAQSFPGYQACAAQPDAWFDPTPASGSSTVHGSVTVSPGRFAAEDTAATLPRDLVRFREQVKAMDGSRWPWHIVSSVNDWSAGTAIEPATEWRSVSGHGLYEDIVQRRGRPPATPSTPATLAAAGDIACSPTSPYYDNGLGDEWNCAEARTASVISSLGVQAVLALGDDQYENGELGNFQASFDPTWGRFRSILHPAVGNHEYQASDVAAGYFTYFNGAGAANGIAGPTGKGWYSFDLGGWHIVALNSMCWLPSVGGCDANSPQVRWLHADLASHPNACVLAYWHHPLFTSGGEGPTARERPLWNELYRAGAEIVLNGHDHDYERFRPQSPAGVADLSGGIREFVVGTGGKTLLPWGRLAANSVVRSATSFGVLKLTLHPDSYDWQFVSAGPEHFSDSGTGDCH